MVLPIDKKHALAKKEQEYRQKTYGKMEGA